MIQRLPARPNLEHLKKEARKLLSDWKAGDPEALRRIEPYRFTRATPPALNRAQLVVAREYGFASWPKLKTFVDMSAGSREEAAGKLIRIMMADYPADGKKRIIESLLARHPDLDTFDLGLACALGNAAYVRSALSRNPAQARAKIGFAGSEPLFYCAFSWFLQHDESRKPGIREAVRLLLQHGADPNARIQHGEGSIAPLYGAAGMAYDAETVRMLLEAGADPNDGESCYHAAEHPGHEVFELLFARGVDEAHKSHAIFRKLDFDDLATVRWLLEHGVSPDQRWHADQSTPLMHALNRGRSIEFFRLLIEKGADPNRTDDAGQSPYSLAVTLGRQDVAALLLAHGAKPDLGAFETWVAEVLAGKTPEQTPAFHALGRSQRDLLCQLAGNGRTAEAALLLGAGFPIDLGLWSTPLHAACWHGQLEAARMLIAHGAPLEARDSNYDSTPAGWTMHGSVNRRAAPPETYVAVFAALADAGARMPTAEEGYWQEEGSASPEIQEWLLARV